MVLYLIVFWVAVTTLSLPVFVVLVHEAYKDKRATDTLMVGNGRKVQAAGAVRHSMARMMGTALLWLASIASFTRETFGLPTWVRGIVLISLTAVPVINLVDGIGEILHRNALREAYRSKDQ